MKACILAGGKGTRLKHLFPDTPKGLVPLGGKPILEHQIDLLVNAGINEIFLLTGYRGELIQEYFGSGEDRNATLHYLQEDVPLGTAGAFKQLEGKVSEDIVVLYGDLVVDFDLATLLAFHQKQKALATLVVHPNDHPYDSDLLEINEECDVLNWFPKNNRPDGIYANLVNAAIYVFRPDIFSWIPKGCTDFGTDIFPLLLQKHQKICAYRTSEYIKDMGTEDRWQKSSHDFESGLTARRNLTNPQRAVFLDRDGTINRDVDLLCDMTQLELLPRASQAIRQINNSEFLSICVTNQSVIARNLCDLGELQQIHNQLETLLARDQAYLDHIYFCPHHPDSGYPEERAEYKINCECRKPNTGLVLAAKEK
ncbi:uncharacterized protein METZ01_LOCUS273476, partial [marine metagenome]